MKNTILILISIFLLWGCRSAKDSALPEVPLLLADTVDVNYTPKIVDHKKMARLNWELIHTKLKLSFNWDSALVRGQAQIQLTPHFYDQNVLELDAHNFSLQRVAAFKGETSVLSAFVYDSSSLKINLKESFQASDTITLFIDYTANPESIEGGGTAITSAQGMYFIRENGTIFQIWTQGETTYNSGWFPTIDHPNQKMTQEIELTVPDTMLTISNGELKYSFKNADGTRTDFWQQKLPHSPYLTMLAIGPYAKVTDEWKGKEVSYFVDSTHLEHARAIFGHTPEMIEYYSDTLNFPFPWNKYAQVIAHEFVSGAMENTSATIHGDFVQKTDRELLDSPQDDIIAHELFHQWFGDVVTCESWANLTLNEGFATYGEYLWREYKYGKDDADLHLLNNWLSYYRSAVRNEHNLIRFNFDEPDHMFDAHSYSKGALILHYLRNEMGDKAFFKAISVYLHRHAFQSVEVHHLRLVFEEVTGEDYTPFFNQWYLGSGHPTVILEKIDEENSSKLAVDQSKSSLFLTSLPIRFYTNDGFFDSSYALTSYRDTINIPNPKSYELLQPNPEYAIPGIFQIERSEEDYENQYWRGLHIRDKVEVLTYLEETDSISDNWLMVIKHASKHEHYNIRKRAVGLMSHQTSDTLKEIFKSVLKVSLRDSHAHVRRAASEVSSSLYEGEQLSAIYFNGLKDRSYGVMSASLSGLGKRFPERALPEARTFTSHEIKVLSATGYSILGLYGSADDVRYFQKLKTSELAFPNWQLLGSYISFIERFHTENNLKSFLSMLKSVEKSYEPYGTFFQRIAILPLLGISQDLESRTDELTASEKQALQLIDEYISDFRARNE